MKTPAILALGGVIAMSIGLSAAVVSERSGQPSASTQASTDNNAYTPRVTPSDSPTVPPPASLLPTQPVPTQVAPTQVAPVLPKPIEPIGPVLSRVAGHPVIYLTFDDGPSLTHTERILSVLSRHHAKATFFVEGRSARRYPQLIAAELAAGDSVGNHTWTHPHLPTLSAAAIRVQLLSTQHYLRTLGAPAQCFRPPFGETNKVVHQVEADLGIHEYLWTTETKDWTHASAVRDLQRADAGLHPGAIIVFHDGRGSGSAQTVAAVDQFLTRAEAQGYIALPLPC